ncbi:scavenger receptor cysteine-rich type 1 protein M130 isoform X3 [Oreochromis niloticus]|uniref:scavenger receptor cysteine-rich type 1 protein M130 isoform X3 n=1 Tax=Oreochromis niloticus TaxID=8128 RepID=UPI000905D20A|nr:scavenger receptor cysteine-rich type 1 protein M130 isoform X3 [Oreochromis niloticus]
MFNAFLYCRDSMKKYFRHSYQFKYSSLYNNFSYSIFSLNNCCDHILCFHFPIVAYLVASPSPSAGQIRLAGSGSTRCSGRVEIYNSLRHSWGTVCDDGWWDLKDAEVVCRELGCGIALQTQWSNHFDQGRVNAFRSNVGCSGSETSLDNCFYATPLSYNYCNHGQDAGVVCSETLPEPTISLYSNEVTWGQGISITCSVSDKFSGGTFILQKTSGSFSQSQTSSTSSVTFNLHNVNFDHDGLYQCQYMKTSRRFNSSSVRLSVTVRLQTPSISLTSPSAGLVWGPEGAEITRGYSFVLTCSVNSRFSSGRFFLIFSDSNITDSKPAVNNSASFSFPVAEYEHQGNYSCVYEVTVSTQTFNSTATAPITVIIKFPWMLMVSTVVRVVLLLLLVLLVVLLVLRRRRQTQQAHIHTTVTLKTCNEEDDVSDKKRGSI